MRGVKQNSAPGWRTGHSTALWHVRIGVTMLGRGAGTRGPVEGDVGEKMQSGSAGRPRARRRASGCRAGGSTECPGHIPVLVLPEDSRALSFGYRMKSAGFPAPTFARRGAR